MLDISNSWDFFRTSMINSLSPTHAPITIITINIKINLKFNELLKIVVIIINMSIKNSSLNKKNKKWFFCNNILFQIINVIIKKIHLSKLITRFIAVIKNKFNKIKNII